MTGTTDQTIWWACAVTDPKYRPEIRLATAIELARMRGLDTATIVVSAATAAETRPPEGVTLVVSEHVPANQFRFVRNVG